MIRVLGGLVLVANAVTIAVLFLFTVRRVVNLIAALKKVPEPGPPPDPLPAILVLIPCRDEASVIEDTLASLASLDYPKGLWRAVLIDDASRDATGVLLDSFAEEHGNVSVLHRTGDAAGRGKPAALKEALESEPFGEIVAVFDADTRPGTNALSRAARHFGDASVLAVNGRMRVRNADDSLAAYYVYVESLVHQNVTMRAASREGRAALLGANSFVRRDALEAAGGFRTGTRLEDTDLTLALGNGKIVFDPDIDGTVEAPVTMEAYRRQHVGWQRGFASALAAHWRKVWADPKRTVPQKARDLLFGAGYADRPFLVLALAFTVLQAWWPVWFDWWLWAIVLGVPAAQVLAALAIEKAPIRHWLRLPALALVFPVDIANAIQAAFTMRRTEWEKTPRRSDSMEAVRPPRDPDPGEVVAVAIGYNDEAHVAGCLESVLAGPLCETDAIYIDNASSDGSVDLVRERFPGVEIVANETNRGYAAAVNQGLARALERGARQVLLLNTDVVLREGAVKALLAETGPKIAAAGGLALRGVAAREVDGGFGEITFGYLLSRLVGEDLPAEPLPLGLASARDVDYPYGCMWLVNTDAVEAAGPMDEAYFCYHEELEWCHRARLAGFSCRYTPAAVCEHDRYRGRSEGAAFKRRMLARNTIRFLRAHGTVWTRFRFAVSMTALMPLRLLVDVAGGKTELARAQLRGYVEGFSGKEGGA